MERIESAPWELGFKALGAELQDDGTLVIEGIAADFEVDREDEAFEEGALDRGMKSWMDAGGLVTYLHDPTKALGRATAAWRDGKSIKVRAEIPKPAEGEEPWKVTAYNGVKNGIIRGFSVGGKFKRHMTAAGPRIYDMDWAELTVAPLPVNPRTLFALAGKAFGSPDDEPSEEDLQALIARVDALRATLSA